MKALFIGGTGTISTAISKRLVEMGEELYLINRGNKNDELPEQSELGIFAITECIGGENSSLYTDCFKMISKTKSIHNCCQHTDRISIMTFYSRKCRLCSSEKVTTTNYDTRCYASINNSFYFFCIAFDSFFS